MLDWLIKWQDVSISLLIFVLSFTLWSHTRQISRIYERIADIYHILATLTEKTSDLTGYVATISEIQENRLKEEIERCIENK